jgi:hypothetical protein
LIHSAFLLLEQATIYFRKHYCQFSTPQTIR